LIAEIDACVVTRYNIPMIRSFRHKGVERLYERDDRRGIPPNLLAKVKTILAHLEEAETIEEMSLPGFRLHPLKGDRKGFWSVSVSGNWRIIFYFDGGHASEVELIDYR
jgi:proteic killer suppression protein